MKGIVSTRGNIPTMFRKTSGAILCPSCGRLTNADAPVCLICGRRNPGMWGFGGTLGTLFRRWNFINAVTVLCVVDRKSTRLNSSHITISYAVFCLNKKKYWRSNMYPDNLYDIVSPTHTFTIQGKLNAFHYLVLFNPYTNE